jgi:AI-2 transport protein TqsA
MIEDRTIKILLLFCALVLIFGALYLARSLIAPVTFSLFVIAIVWPIQRALQRRIPKLLAVAITILGIFVAVAVLGSLLVWGFGKVVQ